MDVTMPQLGETVTEGTITKWFKQVGEKIAADEPLFEVSTDKVDSEVPAPQAGYVTGGKLYGGYGDDPTAFNTWWPCDTHFIGKDITRFHCATWPAMLLAAGLAPLSVCVPVPALTNPPGPVNWPE